MTIKIKYVNFGLLLIACIATLATLISVTKYSKTYTEIEPTFTKLESTAGFDPVIYPHWQLADAVLGSSKRSTNEWAQIAASGKQIPGYTEQPKGDYILDIVSGDGLTLIYENDYEGNFILRDTIMVDSVSAWIFKDNDR